MEQSIWKFRKKDGVILGCVLAAALLLFLAGRLFGTPGQTAVVTVDGTEYGRYPLDEDAVVELRLSDGAQNTLVIEGNRAYMREANCPDRLCVHQGKIGRSGENIVCLPHRVVVSIIGGGADEIDAITG